MTTPYHAKYLAYSLTRSNPLNDTQRLSMSLFNACVDLNPHQIEAALFALRSPTSKGVILADEVGLGKTIEAGLVLCQYWAERRRRLLVICPASIRKQWSLELEEKFNLPTLIIDAGQYNQSRKEGSSSPFLTEHVVITSLNYASKMQADVRSTPWDLVVIDEAHKLRNVYRPSNKMGQSIKWALEDRPKVLMTATPLQNTLVELYGLSSIIDSYIFGDLGAFRSHYVSNNNYLTDLKDRLKLFCKRTLRRQVVEYIKYTERRLITCPFRPSDEEQKFYEAISKFLLREDTYSIPNQQRQLTTLILRKLLASSSNAIAGTLETMKKRLENIFDGLPDSNGLAEAIIESEEMEYDLIEEDLEKDENDKEAVSEKPTIDRQKLREEISELEHYIRWARSIGIDTKTRALISALQIGFQEMNKMGALRKALIFTESLRTQEYLKNFLEANGYLGQVVTFSGSNTSPEARAIYDKWIEKNLNTGRIKNSRLVNSRIALIEHFRDNASIMIATEAGAEGVNLEFCSLVINYDLPWNPQRIEQRIGRCHRYGQKHDVAVINFLNERNHADKRVLEILEEKFSLFSGVFGASDEVLGTIESGVDFEKRIFEIYQQCRTLEEIDDAFNKLQKEMEETIKNKLDETRRLLFEHFDEEVHDRLRMRLKDAKEELDRFGKIFWILTKFILDKNATFNDDNLSFYLHDVPISSVKTGQYYLISKDHFNITGDFLYRLSHPLGEYVVEASKNIPTPLGMVHFNVSEHPAKITVVESLKGSSGWITCSRFIIHSFQKEEYILFSAIDESGSSLPQETCEKLFNCSGFVSKIDEVPIKIGEKLKIEADRIAKATLNRSLEANNRFFQEERDKLEKWADDMVYAVEKALADTKAQIKALKRQVRQANTTEEQYELEKKIRSQEKQQRQQRQNIFEVEDEIAEKRDKLIDALEKKMMQRTEIEPLFSIKWGVV